MKIKTELLQKMVAKAIQGASNNKMIPITSLIGIEAKGDILTLITTDGSNQLRVNQKIELGNDITVSNEFYTIVNADTFAKLVGKTTKEYIELDNKENYLEVIGNGTYKLEIAVNEEGEMVRFPDIKNIEVEPYSVSTELLQNSIKVAKESAAKTMEVPCLTGYYISDKIITTDRQLVCKLNNGIKNKEPILISSEVANLLLLVEESLINILHKDNNLIFYTDTIVISGKELEGKEIYPVKAIEDLSELEYSNNIKIDKQNLLDVLDRMSLFVTDYDKNGVFLNFGDKFEVRSQKSNAVEEISLLEEKAMKEFNCLVDIEMLKSQIETVSTDEVEIQYGQEKSIKIVDKDIIHIISLLEKTE